jgi:HAD superfamily hydrolase (TIGR01509 family)
MAEPLTILFDSDGVIVHSELPVFEINQKIFLGLGIPYTKDDYVEHTFRTALGSSGWLQKNGYDLDVAKQFTDIRNEQWKAALKSADLIEPSASSVLSALALRHQLCVVTNTGREMFDLIYKDSPLRDVFKIVVYREDYENAKPAPDAYLCALEKVNTTPKQAIAVEDSPRGIEAAQQAGLRVIGIVNPDFDTLDISRADYRVESLEELPELISNLVEM